MIYALLLMLFSGYYVRVANGEIYRIVTLNGSPFIIILVSGREMGHWWDSIAL